MASGMPCPRICGVPYFAMRPITRPPITGTRISQGPRVLPAGLTNSNDTRW